MQEQLAGTQLIVSVYLDVSIWNICQAEPKGVEVNAILNYMLHKDIKMV